MSEKKATLRQIVKMLILVIILVVAVGAFIKINNDYTNNFLENVAK